MKAFKASNEVKKVGTNFKIKLALCNNNKYTKVPFQETVIQNPLFKQVLAFEMNNNAQIVNKLSTWFVANRLSLNLSKTNFMVFKPWQKKQSFEFQVFINEQSILRVSETMFLGVFLDNNLTWKPHISLLASKLSKSRGIIHKSRFFLSTQSLHTLYNSMILPYLYYCNLAWGGTYKANLQRIVILQKRTLRIVNNSTYNANTSPIFKELKLLKFHDIHSFQLGFFMFSLKNSTLPSKFNNLFPINSQIHNYNTRNAHSFRLPLCRTNIRQFSIYFRGPILL